MSVTVRYAGQARDAAGTASETAASTSVAALLRELRAACLGREHGGCRW